MGEKVCVCVVCWLCPFVICCFAFCGDSDTLCACLSGGGDNACVEWVDHTGVMCCSSSRLLLIAHVVISWLFIHRQLNTAQWVLSFLLLEK